MPIAVQPLHSVFVARVTGLDLREPLDAATVTTIDNAINRFGVLVFPGQFITDEQQMAFSRRFGDLETTVRAYRSDYVPRLNAHIADVSNLDEKNAVRQKNDRLRLNALGSRLWLHSPPGAGTTLRAELPLSRARQARPQTRHVVDVRLG